MQSLLMLPCSFVAYLFIEMSNTLCKFNCLLQFFSVMHSCILILYFVYNILINISRIIWEASVRNTSCFPHIFRHWLNVRYNSWHVHAWCHFSTFCQNDIFARSLVCGTPNSSSLNWKDLCMYSTDCYLPVNCA